MKDDKLISRLLRRHPHFPHWASGLFQGDVELTALQFAVVDSCWVGLDRCSVSDLYMRLQMEVAVRASRDDRPLRIPTSKEFDRVVRLHLPMTFNVPWRTMESTAPRGRGSSGLLTG